MSNQVIPAEAIQAAHAAICEQNIDDCLDPDWRGKCVKAVEAAAPHMLDRRALLSLADDMEAAISGGPESIGKYGRRFNASERIRRIVGVAHK